MDELDLCHTSDTEPDDSAVSSELRLDVGIDSGDGFSEETGSNEMVNYTTQEKSKYLTNTVFHRQHTTETRMYHVKNMMKIRDGTDLSL